MAWNPDEHVAEARDLAKRRGYDRVIIFSFDDSDPDNGMRVTTYGRTRKMCDETKVIGDWLLDQFNKLFKRG